MDISFAVWAATVLAVLALLVFDFFAQVRTPHTPTLKQASWWSVFYIAIALAFGGLITLFWGSRYGTEYLAGYVTEKSLSVDNLFVFVIIMAKFAVPQDYQQKVLLVGIAVALIMRGIFIAIGTAAIMHFNWVFYLFGLFLVYTAWHVARESHEEQQEYEPGPVVRLCQRVLPTTNQYHEDRVTARVDGRWVVTPMFIVMIAIGMTDLLFALDSIPAIFGLTKEPYIVFTANAFALLGLRQLYFVVGGLLKWLVYLNQGLAIILGFIGVKLIFEAMHENSLDFLNDGQPITWAPQISIWLSLSIIFGVLVVTIVASLLKTWQDTRNSVTHKRHD